MDFSKTRLIVEFVLFTVLEFGFAIAIMMLEGLDMMFSILAIVAMIAYMGVSMLLQHLSKSGDVESILTRSNKRRIGTGLLFAFLFVFAPYRAIRIVGMFAALDALITLLPGKVIFYGTKLWQENKIIYLLLLTLSLSLFLINLFNISSQEMLNLFVLISGNLFLAIFGIFVIIIFLGILGIRFKK